MLDSCIGGDSSGNNYDGRCSASTVTTPTVQPVPRNTPQPVNNPNQGQTPQFREPSSDNASNSQNTYREVGSDIYKYVQAERAVKFRKTAYIGLSNILGYLSRNTQLTVLAE